MDHYYLDLQCNTVTREVEGRVVLVLRPGPRHIPGHPLNMVLGNTDTSHNLKMFMF